MTTSRYPSSADLAAFRKRIHDAEWSGLPQHREPCAWDAPTATAAEAREGIGATGNLDPYKRARLDGVAIHARREASAMRSRAFARGTDCHPELIGIIGAWTRERTEGCPDRFGPMLAAVPWRTGKAPLPPR